VIVPKTAEPKLALGSFRGRRVGYLERFRAELQPDLLGQTKRLLQHEVGFLQPGAAHGIRELVADIELGSQSDFA